MRESFIFYRSYAEALKELPDEQRLILYDAIMSYALDGKEPKLKGIEKAIFALIRPQLQANNKRYENGKKGGRTKSNLNQNETETEPNANQKETEDKPKPNQTLTKVEPNENENVNVNVNENVNVNGNVNEKGVWGENKAKGKTSELPTPLERFLQRWKINSNAIGNYSGGKLSAINWEKLSKKVEQSKRFLQKQKALSFFIEHYADILDGAYDDFTKSADPIKARIEAEREVKEAEWDRMMEEEENGGS